MPLSPALAAYLVSGAEFLLPIMLVLGFGTRFAALGLMMVTALIQLFVQPEVTNLFNEQAVVNPNTTIFTARNDDSLEAFDPFTETPVEGVNWRKGDSWGEAQAEGDYQLPRTFRVSVGLRF